MSSGFARLRRGYARATRRACLAAGAIVFVVLSLPVLFGFFYFGLDLTRLDLGILCALDHQLTEGAGLWLSPTLGNGAAFFARPEVGLLYPPRWIAIALPPDLGTSSGPIFHLSVAAASATWLARTFRVRPWRAAAAGLWFAFSGTALDLILHSHYVVTAAWMPLAWASSRRLLTPRGRPVHVAALGGSLALCLLGGEPQGFVISSALVVLEVVLVLVRWRRRAAVAAACVAGVILAAFAIGLAQWATTLAELSITERGGLLPTSSMMDWSFSPATWPAVIWPGWAHEPVWPAVNVWRLWQGDLGASMPWNRQPYIGSLFVAMALCGVFVRRARLPAVVMLVGVTLALGDQTPVLPLLSKLVPPLALFRYPAKYLLVATLAATMVVAILLQQLSRAHRRRAIVALAGLAVAQVVALGAVSAGSESLNRIAAAVNFKLSVDDLPLLADALRSSILQSLAPLAVGLLLLLLARPRLTRLLPALIVADLLLALPSSIFVGPALQDLEAPMARVMEPGDVLCVEPELRRRRFLGEHYSHWGTFSYLRGMPFPELNACDHLATPEPYSPVNATMTVRVRRGMTLGRAAAARALGCTHYVTRGRPVDGTVTRVSLDAEWWRAFEYLYRARAWTIDDPIPEVFVARDPALVTEQEEVVVTDREETVILALGSTRDAAGAVAVVDDPLGRWSSGPLPDGRDVISVEAEWPVRHRATVVARGHGGAVLGLRTTFQVGWRAEQDGEPLPVVRIAGHHVGVVVPEVSRGPVELLYTPPRFLLGLLAALCGVLALAGIAVWRRPFLAIIGGISDDRGGAVPDDH